MADQAVIAHLKLSDAGFGTPAERQDLMAFEPRLEAAVTAAAAGLFDGDEFGDGECVWYIYGADADVLWQAVEPIVRDAAKQRGGYVIKRRGPPGQTQEERVDL